MRDRLTGGLIAGALAMALALAAPHSTSAQDHKKDSSPAPNTVVEAGSEPLAPRSELRVVAPAPGATKPESPLPPASSYDWTGLYVGGHVGWGQGRADTSFTPLPNAATFIDLRPTTLRPEPSGFNAGVQGGYNWQTGRFVVGAEADLSWSRMTGTARVTPITMNNGSAFPGAGFLITRQDTKWFGTLRPRAGIAFDRVLVYGTGGLAYARVDYSANADFRPGTATPILFFQYPVAFSKTKTGWTAGGGVEVGINEHWSWKAEYLYYDLRRESITANPVPANPPFQVAYTWQTKAHTFNTGINFRF